MQGGRIGGLKNLPILAITASVIERLYLWNDDEERDGASNMAVDEWLLDAAPAALLRVYRWQAGWGSFGYFVPAADAAAALPGLKWVRRWTGGGIVDHRADWTYTLVLPKGERLAAARGGESYRVVHRALAKALQAGGAAAMLAGERPPSRGGECFVQAAEHDIVDACGKKLAGAGQRRTALGLLHQGSVALRGGRELAERLANALASEVETRDFSPDSAKIADLVATRYASSKWTKRRV